MSVLKLATIFRIEFLKIESLCWANCPHVINKYLAHLLIFLCRSIFWIDFYYWKSNFFIPAYFPDDVLKNRSLCIGVNLANYHHAP